MAASVRGAGELFLVRRGRADLIRRAPGRGLPRDRHSRRPSTGSGRDAQEGKSWTPDRFCGARVAAERLPDGHPEGWLEAGKRVQSREVRGRRARGVAGARVPHPEASALRTQADNG